MIHAIRLLSTHDEREQAKSFVNTNHSYIQWADRPSRKIYWSLWENERMVGVFGLGSAFHRPKAVQDYMERHTLAFNEVANNIVYCLSGHTDRNTGSKFLALLRRDAIRVWRERYGDTCRAFQTFILPPRTGAMYKADNWHVIGMTSGTSSLRAKTIKPSEVSLYPSEKVERRVFKSGEVKYLFRYPVHTEAKIILMRLA